MLYRTCTVILTFVLALFINACATNPVTGKQDLVFMSEKDEIALGQQVHQQILQQYSVYNDSDLQNYVQYVGAKVAAKSHRDQLNYQFTVLDSDEVNAFALPGGYIYITRGLMAYLDTEAELAAVLGHEVGHVTARHAVRQHSATQLANIGIGLGAAFIPGVAQTAGQQLAGVLGTALLSGYGREHELESDRLGAEYLAQTGYDPQAMLDVIRILKNQESFEIKLARAEGRQPRVYHGLFASHPDNDQRLQEVITYADNLKQTDDVYVGRDAYINRVDEMVYGENTDEGILREQNFYHGGLGFALRFPKNWQVKNQTHALIAGPNSGNAILQITLKPIDRRLKPREFMIQHLGLKQLSNDSALTIHGLDAYTATAGVDIGGGSRRMSRINVIYYQNYAYILTGITKNTRSVGHYDKDFMDVARSFRPLTAAEREAAKPLRIKLIRANANTTYQVLAANSPIEKFPEQQLRLLNGDYPNGTISPGDIIKIVH